MNFSKLFLCIASVFMAWGCARSPLPAARHQVMARGGIVQADTTKRALSLVFTAHDHADGADSILSVLGRHGIKGAFFFTGLFYDSFPDVVKRLQAQGHYLGSHSDAHLLYIPWENRDSLLVTKEEFAADLERSYQRMAERGITKEAAPVFLPPYEYYNDSISKWTAELGLQLVNFTPGTWSNADYTTPDMPNYRSSQAIYQRILDFEKEHSLCGHMMLVHFGTDTARTDKFYTAYLDSTIVALQQRGYQFLPILQLLQIESIQEKSGN